MSFFHIDWTKMFSFEETSRQSEAISNTKVSDSNRHKVSDLI